MTGIRCLLIFLLVLLYYKICISCDPINISIIFKFVLKNIQYCTLIFGSLIKEWLNKKIIQETTGFILLYNKQRTLCKSRTYGSAKKNKYLQCYY